MTRADRETGQPVPTPQRHRDAFDRIGRYAITVVAVLVILVAAVAIVRILT